MKSQGSLNHYLIKAHILAPCSLQFSIVTKTLGLLKIMLRLKPCRKRFKISKALQCGTPNVCRTAFGILPLFMQFLIFMIQSVTFPVIMREILLFVMGRLGYFRIKKRSFLKFPSLIADNQTFINSFVRKRKQKN